MIRCQVCESLCPDGAAICPKCHGQFPAAVLAETAPPKPLRWEIVALGFIGGGACAIGALLLVVCFIALAANSRHAWEMLPWSIALGVGGLLFRAIAGIWAALERIASRDDP